MAFEGIEYVRRRGTMKTTNYLLSFFAIILLAGCLHAGQISGDSLTEIKLGMTKQEVVGILRKPQGVSANEKFEKYRYFVDLGDWRNAYYDFIFVDDKLTLFGVADDPDFKVKIELISK